MEEKPREWEAWALKRMKGLCAYERKTCTPRRIDPQCRACFDSDKKEEGIRNE